jgi:hypothetical protein
MKKAFGTGMVLKAFIANCCLPAMGTLQMMSRYRPHVVVSSKFRETKKTAACQAAPHSSVVPGSLGLVCVRIVVPRLQDAMGGFPHLAHARTRLVTSDLRTSLSGTRPPSNPVLIMPGLLS